jgi:hypothetical protein
VQPDDAQAKVELMFYLWIGVMTGLLLAYLWTRAQTPGKRKPSSKAGEQTAETPKPTPERRKWWKSERWWLAGVVLALLFSPMLWDVWRTGSGILGPIEAIKTILLPWAAGVGFGIWMHPIVVAPLLGRTASSPTPSFIPLAVAIIFVTLIVSEERYGWFSRLQKITVGGSGLEFSPAPATSTASQPSARSQDLSGTGSGPIGVGRVAALIDFMSGLANAIERDKNYAIEVAYTNASDTRFQQDADFAKEVIGPLGDRLKAIHDARVYNSIEFLVEHGFVDDFRAFVQNHRKGSQPPPTGRGSAENMRLGFQSIWSRTCKLYDDLQRLEEIKAADPNSPACDKDLKKANSFLESKLGPHIPPIVFNPDLPYGTLLAAVLLNAAGEADAALRDLRHWSARNTPKANDTYRRFAAYRALFQAAYLSGIVSPSLASTYPVILQLRRVVELGDALLSTTGAAPGKLPWRAQLRRFEGGDRVDPLWLVGVCSNDLTTLFKRFMLAHLSATNNLAYFLSQDPQFARHQGFIDEMEKRGDYPAKKVNVRCLEDEPLRAIRTSASFFDTAAAVQLALASTEQGRSERRVRLCQALAYSRKAVGLFDQSGLTRSSSADTAATDKPGWELADKHATETDRLEETEVLAVISGRLERIQSLLSQAGLDCQT